jgi:hypothetical protein
MKYAKFAFIILVFFACSKKDSEIPKKIVKLPERLLVIEDLRNIRFAIERYKIENGCLPSSIEELKLKLNYPDEYIYDQNTGIVKSKNYENL